MISTLAPQILIYSGPEYENIWKYFRAGYKMISIFIISFVSLVLKFEDKHSRR